VLDEHLALFNKYDTWRMREYAAFRRQRLDELMIMVECVCVINDRFLYAGPLLVTSMLLWVISVMI